MVKPKVSVCVITFNQERYIRQCLQSIVDQATEFDFEVIVADDCSSDGTKEIIQEFVEKHSKIRAIYNLRNMGGTKNSLAVHAAATGDYVAHIDGDDIAYPEKLQRQFDYLENNPGLVACGHNVAIIDEDGLETGSVFPSESQNIYQREDVILWGMPFAHSSLMYRRASRSLYHADHEVLDWYVVTDLMRQGPIGLLPEPRGAYRINQMAITQQFTRPRMKELMMEMYCLRAESWPELRAQFFCVALLELFADLRHQRRIGPWHRRLLSNTVSIGAIRLLLATHRRRKANALALRR